MKTIQKYMIVKIINILDNSNGRNYTLSEPCYQITDMGYNTPDAALSHLHNLKNINFEHYIVVPYWEKNE